MPQARAQSWKGLYHLLQAFGERFEQRDPKAGRAGAGLALAGAAGGATRSSALLLPNWFEDAAEYRLKKALVSLLQYAHEPLLFNNLAHKGVVHLGFEL